jgi:6,7-dimethyl-8-ribityllumazine synthase
LENLTILEGHLEAKGIKFGIIVSRFNDFITGRLLEGALDALYRHGAQEEDVDIIRVPGAFEIPLAAKKVINRYQALICLGALIRGETPHFDYIAAEVTKGIANIGLETGIPITFGIITADSLEQAINRAGAKAGNKGAEAALSAIELADLWKKL